MDMKPYQYSRIQLPKEKKVPYNELSSLLISVFGQHVDFFKGYKSKNVFWAIKHTTVIRSLVALENLRSKIKKHTVNNALMTP